VLPVHVYPELPPHDPSWEMIGSERLGSASRRAPARWMAKLKGENNIEDFVFITSADVSHCSMREKDVIENKIGKEGLLYSLK
jgi:hypothetical protein